MVKVVDKCSKYSHIGAMALSLTGRNVYVGSITSYIYGRSIVEELK